MATYTRLLINYLRQENDREANALLMHAIDELERVRQNKLKAQDKTKLEEAVRLLELLKGGNRKSAFKGAGTFPSEDIDRLEELIWRASRPQNANERSNQDLSGSFRGSHNETNERSNQDLSGSFRGSHNETNERSNQDFSGSFRGSHNETDARREASQGHIHPTYPPPRNRAVVEKVNQQADLEYRSKMAGQAMRYNNPDIADLSDVNRPTKVAERFSELYDNEWTEAFEALTKSPKLNDRDVIDILLKIVEKAYKFCYVEADQQIEKMRSAILNIMGGDSKSTSRPESDALLVQYRKSIAALAIDRLTQAFKKKELAKLFADKEGKSVDVYTRKAVELTWWMCVQDPPIQMCLSSDRLSDSECPGLYRAYTRSGKTPDYFVWPALKLHKNGGVLMKGVMQFK